MKKVYLILMLASVVMFGCGPDESGDNGNGSGTTPTAPAEYTQKAVIEYFSGAWCGWCPDGWVYAENFMNENPGKLFTVVYHVGDGMETTETANIASTYAGGYPTGMVNRIGGEAVSRGDWGNQITQVLATPKANCGLAIDATKDNGDGTHNVTVKLGIGSDDMPSGTYKLHVVAVAKSLVEPANSDYAQANYLFEIPGHAYEGKGVGTGKFLTINGMQYEYSIIADYDHRQSVKDVLTPVTGLIIESADVKAGASSSYDFTVSAPFPVDVDNTQIVAFITENTLATNSSYTYNVQAVDLGSNKDFD